MNKLKIISLTASMVLAMVFTFSCSSNNSPEWVAQSSGSEEVTQSSSSETGSVSLCAGEEYDPDIFRCEYGELVGKCAGRDFYPTYQICEGGVIKNKNEQSSSSELSPTSSSSEPLPPSSSSESPPLLSSSSESLQPLSSSSMPSSSSVVPSSSSAVVFSSSSMPSSSSSACTAANNTETHYCSNGTMKEYGFVDYGGQRYKTVEIGEQVWFAKNLNYNPGTGNSACYSNQTSNCATYGRLYNWATAMGLSSNCNSNFCSSQIQQPHRGICPNGWHIPSNADWDKLYHYADGTSGTESPYYSPTAGRYLKATEGWSFRESNCGPSSSYSYFCEDTYGFSALPGGVDLIADGNFGGVGYYGYWWSASENENNGGNAYHRSMYFSDDYASYGNFYKSGLRSVRCLQD